MAADIIIAVLAAALVVLAVFRVFFSKKHKSGCCKECSKCTGCLKGIEQPKDDDSFGRY